MFVEGRESQSWKMFSSLIEEGKIKDQRWNGGIFWCSLEGAENHWSMLCRHCFTCRSITTWRTNGHSNILYFLRVFEYCRPFTSIACVMAPVCTELFVLVLPMFKALYIFYIYWYFKLFWGLQFLGQLSLGFVFVKTLVDLILLTWFLIKQHLFLNFIEYFTSMFAIWREFYYVVVIVVIIVKWS